MRIFVASPGHLRTVPMGGYCCETLCKLGHEAILFDAGSLRPMEKLLLRPMAKWRGQNSFEKSRLNARLLQAVRDFKPDIFLAIFGFDIFPETVANLRKQGIRTVCWWLNDPIQFERGLSIAPTYEHFFTNCLSSARHYQKRGMLHASCLPHAAFLPVHRPIELTGEERKIWESEACFAGDWGPVRQGILSSLAQKVNIRIWGPWNRRLHRKDRLRRCVVDGYFTAEDMARIFSSTKAAINLHSWFGYYPYGLNPRVFESPACGVLQICDAKEELTHHFLEDEEIVVYRTGLELESKLRNLLKDDTLRRKIADAGRTRVLKDHSYEMRICQMLDRLRMG